MGLGASINNARSLAKGFEAFFCDRNDFVRQGPTCSTCVGARGNALCERSDVPTLCDPRFAAHVSPVALRLRLALRHRGFKRFTPHA